MRIHLKAKTFRKWSVNDILCLSRGCNAFIDSDGNTYLICKNELVSLNRHEIIYPESPRRFYIDRFTNIEVHEI